MLSRNAGRILLQVIGFASLIYSTSGAQSEQTLLSEVLFYKHLKEFVTADTLCLRLVNEHRDSKHIQDYYYYQSEILIDLFKSESGNRHPQDTLSRSYPHGTLLVSFLDSNRVAVTPTLARRIRLADKYLSHAKFMKYREYFLSTLLPLYSRRERKEQIHVAQQLLQSPDLRDKIDSRRILALYATLEKQYRRAIKLYTESIEIDTAQPRERAGFCLLLADCYFQIDRIDQTMKALDHAAELEKNDTWKASTDMAERWRLRIRDYLQNPSGKKPELVVIL